MRNFAPLRLCVILFLFASCSKEPQEKVSKGIYFDIAGYFKYQELELDSAKPQVSKTIIKDGETETKVLSDSIDWKKELKIFADADINKPAWKDSFSADTIKAGSSNTITYKTADEKISVKEIVITTDSLWQPTDISIKRDAKNFLYTSQQTLHYAAKKLYRLDSEMHVRWTFDTKFSVEGVFVN